MIERVKLDEELKPVKRFNLKSIMDLLTGLAFIVIVLLGIWVGGIFIPIALTVLFFIFLLTTAKK